MNTAHLHLILTHVPIVGLGFVILLHFIALVKKNIELQNIIYWLYAILGVFAILCVLTGDGAGEIVKTYPGVSNDQIESHETFGYIVFYGILAINAIVLFAWWFARDKPVLLRKFNIVILIVAILVGVMSVQAGLTGGKIRHTEIEQGIYKK